MQSVVPNFLLSTTGELLGRITRVLLSSKPLSPAEYICHPRRLRRERGPCQHGAVFVHYARGTYVAPRRFNGSNPGTVVVGDRELPDRLAPAVREGNFTPHETRQLPSIDVHDHPRGITRRDGDLAQDVSVQRQTARRRSLRCRGVIGIALRRRHGTNANANAEHRHQHRGHGEHAYPSASNDSTLLSLIHIS